MDLPSVSSPRNALIAILMLALAVRMFGIGTESFWVDEAFSADTSSGSLLEIVELNAKDTHPPGYYVGLSLWRGAWLREGADPTAEAVVLRAYSTAWSLLGIFLLMGFARSLGGDRVAWIAGLFAAINPLDVYFASEARMYSQASTLAIAMSYALWRWCESVRAGEDVKQWWQPALAFTLGVEALLFTHYVGVTLVVAQGLIAGFVFFRARAWSSVMGLAVATIVVCVGFVPWLQYALSFRGTLVNEASIGWTPYPQLLDYVSFVGREFFWGRAHRVHEVWWIPTAVVPIALTIIAARTRWGKTNAHERTAALHLVATIALPLMICAIVCATYQVIYYRPRYSVFLLPPFLIGLAFACRSLSSASWVRAAVVGCGTLMLVGTVVQELTPQKKAWRETAEAWPTVDAPAFYVVLPAQHQRPLRHYLGDEIRHTPMSVLQKLVPLPEGAMIWVTNWPDPLGENDAAYRDWLKTVGPARRQTLPSYYSLTQVEPTGGETWPDHARERFRVWHRPFDVRDAVAGFSDARSFGPIEFDEQGNAVRSVVGRSSLRLDAVAPGETVALQVRPGGADVAPRMWVVRAESPASLFVAGESVPLDTATNEYRVVAGEGDGPLWVGWQPSTVKDAPLQVRWVGVSNNGSGAVALRD